MVDHVCKFHGPMQLVEISEGDVFLGFVWFCPVEECQECDDYKEESDGVMEPKYSKRIVFPNGKNFYEQLEMALEKPE